MLTFIHFDDCCDVWVLLSAIHLSSFAMFYFTKVNAKPISGGFSRFRVSSPPQVHETQRVLAKLLAVASFCRLP